MFLLADRATDSFPHNEPTLQQAINDELSRRLRLADARPCTVEPRDDGAFPQIAALHVDLTGSAVDPQTLPPPPKVVGERSAGPVAKHVSAQAKPMRTTISGASAEVSIDLSAEDVAFDYGRDDEGRPLLLLREARDGHFELSVPKRQLIDLLAAASREQAAEKGVTLTRVDVDVKPLDQRSLRVVVTMSGKKKLFVGSASFTIHGAGSLIVDESLEARLADVELRGDGAVTNFALGLLRPKVDELQRRRFPLSAFSLGEVRLRDVSLDVTDEITLRAAFGTPV